MAQDLAARGTNFEAMIGVDVDLDYGGDLDSFWAGNSREVAQDLAARGAEAKLCTASRRLNCADDLIGPVSFSRARTAVHMPKRADPAARREAVQGILDNANSGDVSAAGWKCTLLGMRGHST